MLNSLKSEMVEMNQRVKAMNDKQDRIVGQLMKELKVRILKIHQVGLPDVSNANICKLLIWYQSTFMALLYIVKWMQVL